MLRGQNIWILVSIQLWTIVSYFIVKFLCRPVIVSNDYPPVLKTFVLSYPNFCEAIAGTITVMYILLTLQGIATNRSFQINLKEKHLYIIGVILSGAYVILQELKIHNLGGKNVYDFNDVVFSITGLITIYILLLRIKPKMVYN